MQQVQLLKQAMYINHFAVIGECIATMAKGDGHGVELFLQPINTIPKHVPT